MQDNQSTDTTKLVEKGWSQMGALLDTHMPKAKQKKRVFWLWFSAAAGIIAVIFGLYSFLSDKQTVLQHAAKIAASGAVMQNESGLEAQKSTTSEIINASGNQAELVNKTNAQQENSNSKINYNKSSNLISQGNSVKHLNNNHNATIAFAVEKKAKDGDLNSDVKAIKSASSNINSFGNTNVINPAIVTNDGRTEHLGDPKGSINFAENTSIIAENNAVDNSSNDEQKLTSTTLDELSELPTIQPSALENVPLGENPITVISDLDTKRQIPLMLKVGGLYNFQSLSPGAMVGIESRCLQFGNKWALSAGINAEYSSLKQLFLTDAKSGYTKVENSNGTQFDAATGSGSSNTGRLESLWAFRVTADLQYFVSPRFNFSLGLMPGILFSRTGRGNSYTIPLEEVNQATKLTRSWDILAGLSMNYRFSNHFGMNTGFRLGITPYISGITNEKPGRAQQAFLGLNYYFN